MGYTTKFEGEFKISPPVDNETHTLLVGLANTRRMKRVIDPSYGIEGEFYMAGLGPFGENRDNTVLDSSNQPDSQPSLWNQWAIQEDHETLMWDGGEKFYNYIYWLYYILNRILRPRKYVISGKVLWTGEKIGDVGCLTLARNRFYVKVKNEKTYIVPPYKNPCPIRNLKKTVLEVEYPWWDTSFNDDDGKRLYKVVKVENQMILLEDTVYNRKYEVHASFLTTYPIRVIPLDQYVVSKISKSAPKIRRR